MPKTITLGISETDDQISIQGIPDEVWKQFKTNAKAQFPDSGEDAWASYLSEVIVSGSKNSDTVTYFMTGVPRDNAKALEILLAQTKFTWDQFHAYLLHSAIKKDNFRLIRFHNGNQHDGVFIATGLDIKAFKKIEEATEKTFEQVMATFINAATNGTITFSPDTTYLESEDVTRPQ